MDPLATPRAPILAEPLTSLAAYLDQFPVETDHPQYEVVDGQPVVSPSPGGAHQRCVRVMLLALDAACPPGHEVMVAPWDWVLWELPRLTIRQPDLLVVRSELATEPRLTGPPLLAVEILSAGSFERDAVTKRSEYAQAGLDDYWVVDPPSGEVFVHRRVGDELRLRKVLDASTAVTVDLPFAVSLHLGRSGG
ncbi:MAG: Uma2 family endonuclease [Actinomycetes bacterium]